LRLRHATISSRCRFFTWTGPDLFDSSLAGTQGVLTYAVEIQTAGRYEILIRNLHNDPVRTIKDFDIILDHLSRILRLRATLHTPCAVFYLVPMAIGC